MVENGTDTKALAVPTDFNTLSDAELMKLTGQTDGGGGTGEEGFQLLFHNAQ